LISLAIATPTTITAPPISKNSIVDDKDDLKHFLGHCLHKSDVSKCLKGRVVNLIDDVLHNDDDWSVNFFNMKMSLSKNPDYKDIAANADETGRTFEDVISQKLKNLMESRVFQVKLADDDLTTDVEQHEARKKKEGKHGHMMMMSGEFLNEIILKII
jgi:hypothetical protein